MAGGDALREIVAFFGVEFDHAAIEKGESAIDGLRNSVKGFAETIGSAFAVKEIFEFTSGLIENADALTKQADSMGLSLAQLQEWNYVADVAGVTGKQLTSVMTRLVATAGKNKAIKELGIDIKNQDGTLKTGADLFGELGDKISQIEDPGKRAQLSVAGFGKQGLKLLPIFDKGAEGIEELRKEFRELGGGFSEDFGKKSKEFSENMVRIKTIARQVGINIVDQLLPSFLAVTIWLVKAVKLIVPFVKNSRLMEAGLITLAVTGVYFLIGALGGLSTVMSTLFLEILPLIALFLLLEDVIGFLNGDDSLTGDALTKFFGKDTTEKVRKFFVDIKDFFGSIGDPLKSLDLVGKIESSWDGFTAWLSSAVADLFGPTLGPYIDNWGRTFLFVLDLMTGGWDNLVNKLSGLWAGFCAILDSLWIPVKFSFLGGVAEIQDAFTRMFNFVLGKAAATLGLAAKVAGAIGASDTAKDLADLQASVAGKEGTAGAADANAAARAAAVASNQADITAANSRLNAGLKAGGFGAGLVNTNNVTVNVPPGTPKEQAAAVAKAAGDAVASKTDAAAAQAATLAGGV